MNVRAHTGSLGRHRWPEIQHVSLITEQPRRETSKQAEQSPGAQKHSNLKPLSSNCDTVPEKFAMTRLCLHRNCTSRSELPADLQNGPSACPNHQTTSAGSQTQLDLPVNPCFCVQASNVSAAVPELSAVSPSS